FYKQKERNNLYRFFNHYSYDDVCICMLATTSKKIQVQLDGRQYDKRFVKTIQNVDCDYRNAVLSEIENYKSDIFELKTNKLRLRLSKLFALNGKRFIKTGNKSNRVYHSLSNLSKISRKYLHIKGQQFYDIDITNCQPLILSYYLLKMGLPVDNNYISDCEQGLFYEGFFDVDSSLSRAAVKEQLYKSVFFAWNTSSPFNQMFGYLYPDTFYSLSRLYQDESLSLAAELQNIESNIFNGLDPEKSKYYFTLFDSIYFTDLDDLSSLRSQIKERFKDMPVILLTSLGEDVSLKHPGLFHSVLIKPVRQHLLHQHVLKALSKVSTVVAESSSTVHVLNSDFAARNPLSILLVEDNLINQLLATTILTKLGYQPKIANNGLEAIEMLSDHPYDLILMDMQMPEMDGVEATKHIRQHFTVQPIIIAMTANAMQEDRETCLQAGMNDYLSKPVKPEDLMMMVQKWSLDSAA
ncbi:MAG: response regulator, partial [Chitinophagaceae bacterium]